MTVTAPALLAADLALAARNGGAVIFPTDTLPALATLPSQADQIWQLKQRPRDKPLILMAADQEALEAATGVRWRPEWKAAAAQVWPGAFTLVLPASGWLAQALHPGGGTLGLRIPAAGAALELLEITGPLATTSANRSGAPPCRDAEEAALYFPAVPRLAPLPWRPGSGEASTVLAWSGQGWRTLRAGAQPTPYPEPP